MRPVLILQHLSDDGPAYLATWLRQQGLSFEVRNTEAGQPFPDDMSAYRALAVLGGEMSANDALPSLRQAEALILQAMRDGQPVLGHCLGGQLMARALGARIAASPAPEVGWQPMQVHAVPAAVDWLGPARTAFVCHWHYEAFDLPPGAVALAGSPACPFQAFDLGGLHLGMQFHIEIDAAKLKLWAANDSAHFRNLQLEYPETVQSGPAMVAGLQTHLATHQALASRIYARWISRAI